MPSDKHTGLRRFYGAYQFVVPLVFFPYAYWLWWTRLQYSHSLALLVMFVPVISYYTFVMIGILRFRLWRFNTRPTIRGIRPHHGFVFSTGAAMLFYLCVWMVPAGAGGLPGVVTAAFLGASVFGFWNWWYETYAIKSGFISIYTKKIAEGASAEEAVTDYAPFLFGSMGACYGALVKTAENLLLHGAGTMIYWLIAITGGLSMILIPAAVYLLAHRVKHRESGLRTYVDDIEKEREMRFLEP